MPGVFVCVCTVRDRESLSVCDSCIVGSLSPFVILQCHSNVNPTCPDCYALYNYICIHIKSTNVVKGRDLLLCTFLQYYQRISCYLRNIKSLQNLVHCF